MAKKVKVKPARGSRWIFHDWSPGYSFVERLFVMPDGRKFWVKIWEGFEKPEKFEVEMPDDVFISKKELKKGMEVLRKGLKL